MVRHVNKTTFPRTQHRHTIHKHPSHHPTAQGRVDTGDVEGRQPWSPDACCTASWLLTQRTVSADGVAPNPRSHDHKRTLPRPNIPRTHRHSHRARDLYLLAPGIDDRARARSRSVLCSVTPSRLAFTFRVTTAARFLRGGHVLPAPNSHHELAGRAQDRCM
jgi:hypothetical protein